MSVTSWCSTCFCVVLSVGFCTGYFVMVLLNLTYLHCLQHCFNEHHFNLYYSHTDMTSKSSIFWVNLIMFQLLREATRTRKSKTEAVLQRRSMLKLGVICKFMKRYWKCFMSWNVHLEFQVLCLRWVIF